MSASDGDFCPRSPPRADALFMMRVASARRRCKINVDATQHPRYADDTRKPKGNHVMTLTPGMKIIVTNSHYCKTVHNGTIMTVVSYEGDGDVCATVDGGDDIAWFMGSGTYEPYIVKSDDTAPADGTPVLWRDMTPEEKGLLLLAHHEGETVEYFDGIDWSETTGVFSKYYAYRVKPAEPVIETVTLTGADFSKGASVAWSFRQNGHIGPETHRITFNLIDGKPDVASIKMEEL